MSFASISFSCVRAAMIFVVFMWATQALSVVSAEESLARDLGGVTCASFIVPACINTENRDLLFLVDTSESMNRATFYSKELDMIQSFYCMLNTDKKNRLGLLTFSNAINVRIPFAEYNQVTWFSKVEAVRKNAQSCCQQGTPMAEAFQNAKAILAKAPAVKYPVSRSVFVISDGEPYQLTAGSNWKFPGTTMANYMLNIVPSQAAGLKALNVANPVRLIMIGIPSNSGVIPRVEYFSGIPDPTLAPSTEPTKQCYTRSNRKSCGYMASPPVPLVTSPVNQNMFVMNFSADVNVQIYTIVSTFCTVAATNSPTSMPTNAPTNAPTGTPTLTPTTDDSTSAPTFSPTLDPTSSPTLDPTSSPTLNPTSSPTLDPTSSPTSDSTSSPTLDPTSSPTLDPTSSPTLDPTSSPTLDPTSSPTLDPTSSPTLNPTLSPTKSPTLEPTNSPSKTPTAAPTFLPTLDPTLAPTHAPTKTPTLSPTSSSPTSAPTKNPTLAPTRSPTNSPTCAAVGDDCNVFAPNSCCSPGFCWFGTCRAPTPSPTKLPTRVPTRNPTKRPTTRSPTGPTRN